MTQRALFRSPPSARTTLLLGWLLVGLLIAGAAAALWARPGDWRTIAAAFGPVAAVATLATLLLGAEAGRREATEAALAASERRYRAALEGLDEVAFGMDASGHWTALGRAWGDLTGHAVEASLGRPFLFYVHPDDRPGVVEALQPLMAKDADHCRCELRLVGLDGGARWVEFSARRSAEGTGMSGTLRDITERHATGEALAASERRLEAVTEILQTTLAHIGEGVLVIDADRRIPICNGRAIELLDLDAAALENRVSFDELAGQCQKLAFGTLDLSPGGGTAAEMLQVFDRHSPKGRLLALHSAALPQGGVVRIYADVTESREAEAAPPTEATADPVASGDGADAVAENPVTPAELRDAVVAAFGATLVPEDPEPEADPLFDDEKIAALRRTYGAAAPRFGTLFRKDVEARLRRIAKLLRTGDAKLLAAEAESMRGSALTFGCRAVQEAASRLEEAARAGEADRLPALVDALKQAFDDTRDELANRLLPAA